jgi:hypothetical protein
MGHRVGRSIDQAFPEEQSGNAASLNQLRQQGNATLFLGTVRLAGTGYRAFPDQIYRDPEVKHVSRMAVFTG